MIVAAGYYECRLVGRLNLVNECRQADGCYLPPAIAARTSRHDAVPLSAGTGTGNPFAGSNCSCFEKGSELADCLLRIGFVA